MMIVGIVYAVTQPVGRRISQSLQKLFLKK